MSTTICCIPSNGHSIQLYHLEDQLKEKFTPMSRISIGERFSPSIGAENHHPRALMHIATHSTVTKLSDRTISGYFPNDDTIVILVRRNSSRRPFPSYFFWPENFNLLVLS